MTPSATFRGLAALATTFLLLLAAPAIASVPAGEEYLPQVPSATGDKPVSEKPDTGGSTAADAQADKDKGSKKDDGTSEDDSSGLAAASGGNDGDGSGGVLDTLFDPIVLLLIAGVLTIAVGMMLARKQNGDSPDPSRARRASSDAPLPPDGEIVGGTERP